MKRLVLFGAGNIGRSFVGQLFARNGYEVVFVDINERIISALNSRRRYDVVVRNPDGSEERLPVEGVRGVHATDREAVVAEIAAADIAATAVGAAALPAVSRLIRDGMAMRANTRPGVPLDLILAENLRDAAAVVREAVGSSALLGLVRTSIGKMVPIVPPAVAEADPLLVFAEPYNTLIVDAKGFLGAVPAMPEIRAVDAIDAWVDRKLYIHNLGHAAVAYLGFRVAPDLTTIAEAITMRPVREAAAAAMTEAADALARAYPESFAGEELASHRDDLLQRFSNRSLGDTVFRVGRDLRRKLARDDRLVGAMLLAAAHGCRFDSIAPVYRAACAFRATDESGGAFEPDLQIVRLAESRGIDAVLRTVSGLRPDDELDSAVAEQVVVASDRIFE